MNTKQIFYRISLCLFSLIILGSIYSTFFNYDQALYELTRLGYPEHLLMPLAIAQLLGLAVIITNKGRWLINWAYSGFSLNLIFAIIAHLSTHHGNGALAVFALIILWVAYVLNKQFKHVRDLKKSKYSSMKQLIKR